MTQLSIRIVGLDKVQTGFNQYAQTIEPVCRATTYAALLAAPQKSPGYLGGASYTAPLPPSGVDVRTGNAGRSVTVVQEGASSRINADAYSDHGYEYGHRLWGDAYGAGQADWAVGSWVLLREAVDEQIQVLTTPGQGIDAALIQQARDLGLA